MGLPFRRPASEDAPTSGCLVAVLDAVSLACSGRDYSEFLSATEGKRHGAFRTTKRKSEWLAGRLAAKYLFLNQMELGHLSGYREWPPRLMPLSTKVLDDFPVSLFRAVELLPSGELGGGPLWLRFGGKLQEAAVTVSHAGDNACACLSKCGTVGTDVENVSPKVVSFYRSNFTNAEREWAERAEISEEVGQDWLYTLLWTVKEAALKARVVVRESPWSFSGIGLCGLPPPRDLLSACRYAPWGDYFGLFTALIEEDHNSTPVQVAFAATSQVIVTLVRRCRPPHWRS
jgi:4'-phosphopantetheinyl transferase EntD